MNEKNTSLGERGEYLAKCYLEKKGFDYVRSNFRTKHGEIDLIMIDKSEIVFVEVKTRTLYSASLYGRGTEKIDGDKIRHIRFSANEFMKYEKNLTIGLEPRFDSVEIYLDDDSDRVIVNHIENAF